ncbi:MAG: Mur ligase family protein, partial [Candidatus Woesearchaeota archaeon]
MNISKIIREDFEINGEVSKIFKSISYNSKDIKKGDLFVAIKGLNNDGHDFIDEAIKKGASAIVFEKTHYKPINNKNVTWIGVDDSRDALAWIASRFYDNPSKDIHLIGITGTNGKTSTTYMVESIAKVAGLSPGVIGTIEYRWKGRRETSPNTTPESRDLQELIFHMKHDGVNCIIMEVSSHALELSRADDVHFDVVAFTNLTRDHLDFHGNFEKYFEAKKK